MAHSSQYERILCNKFIVKMVFVLCCECEANERTAVCIFQVANLFMGHDDLARKCGLVFH